MDNDIRPPHSPREPDNKQANQPNNHYLHGQHKPKLVLEPTPRAEHTPAFRDALDSFKTPEEVAAMDASGPAPSEPLNHQEPMETINLDLGDKKSTEKGMKNKLRKLKSKLALHWPPGKKEWITSAVTVILVGVVVALILGQGHKPVVLATTKKPVKTVPKVTTVPSTLTGLPVDPSVNQRPVTAVMVENSLDARPQSGLGQAGVVFEALAEGGVTRFMALYQDTAPASIGPVRSARPYFIEWALGFGAAYAHVGGSPLALSDITSWGVQDMNQFYNAGSFQRITSRVAPHNVYTSIAALNQLEAAKGYTSQYTGFTRKPKATPMKTPTAANIGITMSGPDYNVSYAYNAATNSYNRSEGGAPHIDANTNTQISPTVVIGLVMPYSLGPLDSSGAYYSVYNTIGSGAAYIFQDGGLTIGQWNKTADKSNFTFTDSSGNPIALDPGQTWITAVGSASDISSSP